MHTYWTNGTKNSYSRLYGPFTLLSLPDFTPELSYFVHKNDAKNQTILNNKTASGFENILENFDDDHLYNQEMWGDLLLSNKTL